jgi:hypothetical protein
MNELVRHLLARKHEIPNRVIIACLAIAQLGPKPSERVATETLMQVLGVSYQPYASKLLSELKRYDLVEYEAGNCAEPGYRFFRVGPRKG